MIAGLPKRRYARNSVAAVDDATVLTVDESERPMTKPEGKATDTALLDPSAEGYYANPYPFYEGFRASAPIQQHPDGPWFAFRYEDVELLLRDSELSVEELYIRETERNKLIGEHLGEDYLYRVTLTRADDPVHARLRGMMARHFTKKSVDKWNDRIQAIIDELLAPYGDGDVVDLSAAVGRPLPYRVMCEFLGLPDGGDEPLLIESSHYSTLAMMEPFPTLEDVKRAANAPGVLRQHFAEIIEWKREHPGDDLITDLINNDLNPTELLTYVIGLFIAGHETTVNAISLAMYSLLRNPSQWELLKSEPDLVRGATEELLRYDNVMQIHVRTTPKEYEVSGRTIPAGARVIGMLGSANRDPEKWGPTADELDITRSDAREHLSFGKGVHTCLGAWLARLEMQHTLSTIVERFPNTTLIEEPAWQPLVSMRAPRSMNLRLGA